MSLTYTRLVLNCLCLRWDYPHERSEGIEAGLVIGKDASFTAVYKDLGISRGVQYGIDRAERENRPIVTRRLFDASLSLAQIEEAIRNQSPRPLTVIGDVYARTHTN